MSFVKTHLLLSNKSVAARNGHRFKLCGKCSQSKPPEGGIDMSPTRWICASCWTIRVTRRKT